MFDPRHLMLWLFPFFLLVGLFLPGFFVAKYLRHSLWWASAFPLSLLVLFHSVFWLGVLPRPHHPVDRAPRPDCRQRRGSLVGTALPASGRNQTVAQPIPPAGSAPHFCRARSSARYCWRAARSLPPSAATPCSAGISWRKNCWLSADSISIRRSPPPTFVPISSSMESLPSSRSPIGGCTRLLDDTCHR